ncbi:AMP-binding enzyme family protein [Mycobacterium xenopi 4042]|uniref:AMP-binding enzyme family protein n=1 Tax=Mycobacterium xenopi 4042 TaxID=1299334 RepID=X8AJV3_MYCXE|nr:AMP-binding enzyme family protein [Mycobacterium xenopi 4042]
MRPDDAMIMFTGGTTGSPKMVPWTHDNIAGSLRGIIATYGLGPQDATVAVMPLFHGHGLMAALLSTLVSGERCCCRPAGGFLRTRSGTTCEPPGHLVHRGADHPPYPVGTQWD